MNNTIKELYERKSVRVFTDKKIPEEDIRLILESAAMAPTAGNQQLYTIINVTDQEKKDRLAESCDHQPFIARAGLVLVFCADLLKWYKSYLAADAGPRDPDIGDFVLAVEDAVIAAQNTVVAAHSLGIGSCYIGDIMENYEIQKEILSLPEYVFPAAMLVFGYPTDQQVNRQKPERIPMEYLVHENVYPDFDQTDLRKMFRHRTNDDFNGYMNRFCERKYNSDFAREMSRSIRAFLEKNCKW